MTDSNKTLIVTILDKSGSMLNLQSETISGFNAFMAKQKEVEGTCLCTFVQFNEKSRLQYSNLPLDNVPALTGISYVPDGWTALNDAICKTIDDVGRDLAAMKESDRPGKVIVMIITDGIENSSKEFTKANVRDRINNQRDKYNWEFIFLGSDPTQVEDAVKHYALAGKSFSYDQTKAGTQKLFSSVSRNVGEFRTRGVYGSTSHK